MSIATENLAAANSTRATLTSQIEALLTRLYPPVDRERRHDDRIAIPVLFRLMPLDADRRPLEQEATVVVGKNISRRGVSFYHEHAITHRRVAIELTDPCVGIFAAEVDITWCRFTKPGWYESGGRLIRIMEPVIELSSPRETEPIPEVLAQPPTISLCVAAESLVVS